MRPSASRRSARAWVALLVTVVVGSVLGFVPDMARAHEWEAPGLNGAQLFLARDGYPPQAPLDTYDGTTYNSPNNVKGRGFVPSDEVQVFQCRAGETDLREKCQLVGLATTTAPSASSPGGEFTVDIRMLKSFYSTSGETQCRGTPQSPQCSVIAATFDETTLQPTSRAEHYFCYTITGATCVPGPKDETAPTTTPTSTTTSTTTTVPGTTTTTTTTQPPPPAEECTLREVAVPHAYAQRSGGIAGGGSSRVTPQVWQQEAPRDKPSAREAAAMAYDPISGQTVLFGGFTRGGDLDCVLGDTWIWDGDEANWIKQHPATSPPARYGHAMADGPSGIVLFGGYDGLKDLGDTWTWDAERRTWVKRQPADAPSPRARTAMAYHQARNRTVLFGGDHDAKTLNDTWLWDGADWDRPGTTGTPPRRGYAAMAYHAPTQEIVLRGGWDGDALGDTWTWSGGGWVKRHESSTYQVHSGAMAYHPGTGVAAFQAGSAGGFVFSDPVKLEDPPSAASDGAWDGTGWVATPGLFSLQDPGTQYADNPGPRTFPVMAEDSAGHLVFFGGYGIRGGSTNTGPTGITYDPTTIDRDETWRMVTPGPGTSMPNVPSPHERMTVRVAPSEIPADGSAKATVTATVTRAGIGQPGYRVTFSTPGDVKILRAEGSTDASGRVSTTVEASVTPGFETITATTPHRVNTEQAPFGLLPGVLTASTTLVESGMTLELAPPSIAPDGAATSEAEATVYTTDLSGERVCFATDGDVTFSVPAPDHCGEQSGSNSWTTTITASRTPGVETITATARKSKLKATAELAEGAGQWFEQTATPGPDPGRENAAMAYDEASGLTVLFGGYHTAELDKQYTENKALGDTWLWDGKGWREATTPDGQPVKGPSAREGAAMAYDAGSRRLILFGGHDGEEYLGDTWSFDSATRTWAPLQPSRSPSPRYVANMASDGSGLVLFGGTDGWAIHPDTGPTDPNGPGHLRDTWTWRNGEWIEEQPPAPAPAPGGPAGSRFTNPAAIKVPLPPPPPGCPGNACMGEAAEPYPSNIAVSALSGTVADVSVTLHGLTYTQNGPPDADIMVVSPDGRSVMVMSDACGTADEPNPVGEPIDLTFDDQAVAPLPRTAACTQGTFRPTDAETPESTPFHSPDAFPAPAPASANSSSLATFNGADPNGTWKLYVADDAPNDPSPPNPAPEAGRIAGGWSLSITTTDTPATRSGPGSPPPRGRGSMAYHPPSGKVVLYGGTQEFQIGRHPVTGAPSTSGAPFRPLADTWLWDPGTKTWAQEGVGPHPGARRSAPMAYHRGLGQLMLFAGSATRFGRVGEPQGRAGCPRPDRMDFYCPDDGTYLNDTWTWDGRAWARQRAPISPPAARLAGMAPDSAGHLVVVSDRVATTSTWTWEPKVAMTLERTGLPADGASTTTAVVTVHDSLGRPVPGLQGVRFTTDGEARLSAATDRGDGTYAATVTASQPKDWGVENITVRTPLGSATAILNEVGPACRPGAGDQRDAGTWTAAGEVADLPTPRFDLAAAPGSDGRIYTFGGKRTSDLGSYGGPDFADVEAYDPCTNLWTKLPPMPSGPRFGAMAAAGPDGRIYVVGGSFYNITAIDRADVYIPGSGADPGRWETLPRLPTTKSHGGASVDKDGNLFVSGGMLHFHGDDPYHAFDTVDVYSPASGSWTRVPPLSQRRYFHGSATGPDGRVFAMGGLRGAGPGGSGTPDETAEAYNWATQSWERVAPMTSARNRFGAAVGPDGLMYASGGDNGYSTGDYYGDAYLNYLGFGGYSEMAAPPEAVISSVEAYVGCIDAWVPVAPMPFPRSAHQSVTGSDGRVYVLGGAVRYEPVARVEAYTVDPTTSPCPKVSVDDQRLREGRSGTTQLSFSIHLDRPVSRPVVVDYATKDGSALAGSDYEATSGTVVFAPGDTEDKIVQVPVKGDAVPEDEENFFVEISSRAQPSLISFAKARGTATILDGGLVGDPPPEPPVLSIAGSTTPEPFSDAVEANFAVTLSEAASETVSFDVATADGTAVAGADYTTTSARLDIPAGRTSTSFIVPVLGDTLPEPVEHFTVRMSNPVAGKIGIGEAKGGILDAVEGLAVGDASVVEGNGGTNRASFTVTLSRPSPDRVSVDYATHDDSALAWRDYAPITDTLVFAPGEQSKVLKVGAVPDTVAEPTEHFSVRLSKPLGTTIGSGDGTGTILDDDGPLPPAQPVAPPPGSALTSPLPPPPPAPVAQGQAHAQAQAQAQTQAQQQAQQQAQSQAQSQGESQAQVQTQGGLAEDRQRERQVERAHISSRDAGGAAGTETHLATELTDPSPLGSAPWPGVVAALGVVLAVAQQGNGQRSPAPLRAPIGANPTRGSGRLPTQRIRGRHRRLQGPGYL